jgi:hypothetical protein
MDRRYSRKLAFGVLLSAVTLLSPSTHAATKAVDLDGNAANGAESQCDLNVLQTFPVKIENKVTNKAVGDAYNFSWRSAGPGGFTSSVTPGSAGGVGSKWVWTTNQSVYSYTGSNCDTDLCFVQTAGPDAASNFCSNACVADGAVLTLSKGTNPGDVNLGWAGGQGPFTVYRSTSRSAALINPANAVGTTSAQQFTDATADGASLVLYAIRGVDCTAHKTCASDNDCNAATEGTCISRGPFSVPGRSLFTTDVTVSASSLTSSLITFFSPPKEVFRVTSSVAPGGSGVAYQQTLTNTSTQPVTVTVAAYPPGCCLQPHQINCDGTCFDYLTDPNNCGGCGVVCGEGTYCGDGACVSVCQEDQTYCGGSCVDLQVDRQNCGACGNVCETIHPAGRCEGNDCYLDQICVAGGCVVCDAAHHTACDNTCVDVGTDPNNCGICGSHCDARCPAGTVSSYCNGGGSCCCVQPDAPEVCVPSFDPVASGFASQRAPVDVLEAPICETPASQTIIPPGGTTTDCLVSGVLAKEVPTSVVVCGDNIPDGAAQCANGDPASMGTFMKLIPDPSKPIGNAYVTPYAVHVTEPSRDGLIEPGETAKLSVEVLNAGPSTIFGATATLVSPPVDLTDDGVDNPVGVAVSSIPVSFGNILGTTPSEDCTTPSVLHPASSIARFQITIPANHPADTSRPFILQFTGEVGELPFAMDMPIALGIADKCDYSAHSRDYDGLVGLNSPMGALIPVGDQLSLPLPAFPVGETRPLELVLKCGSVELTDADVDAPEIVAFSEATRGPIDLSTIYDEHHHTPTRFFIYEPDADERHWEIELWTGNLRPGTYTMTIRIAGRKDYVTGFVLQ